MVAPLKNFILDVLGKKLYYPLSFIFWFYYLGILMTADFLCWFTTTLIFVDYSPMLIISGSSFIMFNDDYSYLRVVFAANEWCILRYFDPIKVFYYWLIACIKTMSDRLYCGSFLEAPIFFSKLTEFLFYCSRDFSRCLIV